MSNIASTSSYEVIANEYYDERHITSRNFDAATLAFCNNFEFSIPNKGPILELGAGKGSTGKYCRAPSHRIIQIDVSRTMLLLNPREACVSRINCSAMNLPVSSLSVSAVTAFLYDVYNKQELYFEVSRVLRNEGLFIGTLPHGKWGTALRHALKYDADRARFITEERQIVELDSFLMDDQEIAQVVVRAGLTLKQTYDLFLPTDVERVSRDIMVPASYLGLTAYTIPVVKLVIAQK